MPYFSNSSTRHATQLSGGHKEMIELSTPDGTARADLLREFEDGLRWLLRRQAKTANIEGRLNRVVARVVTCIRSGRLRSPERLPSLVRAAVVGRNGSLQRRGLEQCVAEPCDIEAARAAADALTPSERNALARYYLQGQSVRRLCLSLRISEDHFQDIRRRFLAEFNSNLPRTPAANLPAHARGAVA